jgi:hypothetical protein
MTLHDAHCRWHIVDVDAELAHAVILAVA